jgi:hypothetical protein
MKRRIPFSVRMGDLQMFSGSVEVLKSDTAGKTRHGPCISHMLIMLLTPSGPLQNKPKSRQKLNVVYQQPRNNKL